MSASTALWLFVPWAFGVLVSWNLARAIALDTRWLFSIGVGLPLGYGLVALLCLTLVWIGNVSVLPGVRWILCTFTGLALTLRASTRERYRDGSASIPRWPGLLTVLIVGVTLLKLSLISFEALVPPPRGWDTWQSWLPRAITWFYHGNYVAFMSTERWLSGDLAGYRLLDPSDPPVIPSIMLWGGATSGAWNMAGALAPWPAAWAATTIVVMGIVRALGNSPRLALLSGGLFLLLPYPAVQAALPGYSDIWVALLIGTIWFHVAIMRSTEIASSPFMWISMAGFIALLIAIKDGAVLWGILIIISAFASSRFPSIFRWAPLLPVSVLIVVPLLPSPGPDPSIPLLGTLGYRPDSVASMLHFMFLSGDWSLLFWLMAFSMAISIFPADPYRRVHMSITLFLSLGLSALFILFTLTNRAEGVISGEIFNRSMLHIVPMVVIYVAVSMACWYQSNEHSGESL